MKIQNETLSPLDTDGETNHKNQSSRVHSYSLLDSHPNKMFLIVRGRQNPQYIVLNSRYPKLPLCWLWNEAFVNFEILLLYYITLYWIFQKSTEMDTLM